MCRLNGATALLGVLLSALILIGVGVKSVSSIACSYKNVNNFCTMVNISVRTDAEARKFVFPNETLLWFIEPNISQSGKMVFDRVPNTVEKIEITGGSVPEVTIKSTLVNFRANGNHIREVIIDETGPYLINYFGVWRNQLQSVPKNVTKLTNLVNLYLYENEIEIVNMDHFKGLNRLVELSLFGNRITRIDTTVPLGLPKLTKLHLYKNYLDNLSIKLWNFPNLNLIRLDNNKLHEIESFPDRFPKLNGTTLYYNRWNCSWLAKAKMWTGKILVYKGDESCSENNIQGICCEDDKQNYLVKTVANQLQQTSFKLQGAVAQIDDKLSTVASDIQKINALESENRVRDENSRNKLENKVDELGSDMNRTAHAIKEEVKAEESKIKAKVLDTQAQISDMKSDTNRDMQTLKEQLKSTDSTARKELSDKLEEINAKMNENQVRLDKSVDDLKNDLIKQLSKTNRKMERKLKRMQENLNANRAMILKTSLLQPWPIHPV